MIVFPRLQRPSTPFVAYRGTPRDPALGAFHGPLLVPCDPGERHLWLQLLVKHTRRLVVADVGTLASTE